QQIHSKEYGDKGKPGPGFQGNMVRGNLKVPHLIEKQKGEQQQVDYQVHLPIDPGIHIPGKDNDGQHEDKGTLDAPTEEGNGYGSDHGQDTCRIVGDQKVLMAL